MSEFEQFFKNSQIRELQVSCAIIFGGGATKIKVIVPFKSQKIMFFEEFNKAHFLNVKNMNFCDLKAVTGFRCIAMPPNLMAHNT